MDIATFLGLVLGFGFIVWGIMTSGEIITYIHLSSLFIVLGGTAGATMIAYPIKDLKGIGKIFKKAFFYKETPVNGVIEEIIELANVARKEGLLALEEFGDNLDDEFLKKGINLIVDGTDPELVRNILETELTFLEERHDQAKGILESMGTYSPAFGMIGTLIGLINMLKEMDDPATIGPNMSVALITTFYGSLFANIIFLPLAQKLSVRSKSEILLKELMVEGLLSIQAGENPRIIEEKLKTFITPIQRKKLQEEEQMEVGSEVV